MPGPAFVARRGRAAAVLSALACVLAAPAAAQAHGSLISPPSRTFVCRFLEPHAPQCEQAWAAEPQALYDWMEVNIRDAGGRHRALIPDGTLCGAGRAKYHAFDAATTAWPATPVTAGPMDVVYRSTAPHATSSYRLYLTRPGFDVRTPLGWDDLVEIYDSGPRPAAAENRFAVDLPARTGHQILYYVWQRSDSLEAFYGCSDVLYPGGDGTTPTITHTTTTDPEAGGMPSMPGMGTGATGGGSHGGASHPTVVRRRHLTLSTVVDSDWGTGSCATVTVTNRTARPITWSARLRVHGRITSMWSAVVRGTGRHRTVRGAAYNRRLAARAATSFGYCTALR